MNQHLKQLSAVHYDRGSPGPLFENWLEASDHREQRLLAVDFELPSPWAGQGASTSLTAVYLAGCEAGTFSVQEPRVFQCHSPAFQA